MLARLPKPALVSNRKVLPSIKAFSRTSAPGERRHPNVEHGPAALFRTIGRINDDTSFPSCVEFGIL
jgi:hypothetical protein